MQRDKSQKLVGLFLLALILLNFPLIGIFSRMQLLWDIPVLLIYILVSWVFIIVITAITVNKKTTSGGKKSKSKSNE